MNEISRIDRHSPSNLGTPLSGSDEANEIAEMLTAKLTRQEIIRVRHLLMKGCDPFMLAGELTALLEDE